MNYELFYLELKVFVTNQVHTQSVLTFDGIDDYIDFGKNDIGGVFAQGSSAFTVSGWVNPHQITNKTTSYGTSNVFFARSSDRYSDNFEFGISETGNLDAYIDESVSKVIKTFGNGELTIGQWHFFAIVFNSGQLTVYLDDRDYTGSVTGSSLNKATSPVTLGATLHKQVYFTGQLANISVWNCPCTQAQIQTHLSGLIVGDEAGLVAYWKLDEGKGTTVKNQTGNSYQGTLRGNPSWDIAQIPFAAQSSNSVSNDEDKTKEIQPTQTNTEKLDSIHLMILSSQVEESKKDRISQSEVPASIQQTEIQILTQEKSKETMEPTTKPKYKILSIDGGGIRGIIPALILAEIEKRTKQQIFSLFDLFAGTSTGGIITLGLTKPRLESELSEELSVAEYSAEDLAQLYVEYGAEIFYEPFFEHLLGPLEDMFVQSKYASDGREEIIRKYFGNAPLEKNLKEVFVTSYDLEQRIPVFFTNKIKKQQTESKRFRKLSVGFTLTDAAMATSTTPTYFPPYRVATSHNPSGYYTLVDGGLFANNPTNLAIVEAKISGQEKDSVLHTDEILIVSLGTGSLTSVYRYEEAKNWGLLQWARPLLNIAFDGGSEVVAGELERLFAPTKKEIKGSYYRFQTFLSGEQEEIDNVKSENIRQLQAVAHRLITEKSQQIDELCTILTS